MGAVSHKALPGYLPAIGTVERIILRTRHPAGRDMPRGGDTARRLSRPQQDTRFIVGQRAAEDYRCT